MRISDSPSRRDVLRTLAAIGAAGVLAGCDLLATPPAEPDPLLSLLQGTRALVDAYATAASGAAPDLVAQLNPLREAHKAHLAALEQLIGLPSAAATSAKPSPAPTGVPGGIKGALLAMERTAAKAAFDACLTAAPGRATVLGEIAAARATHLVVLAS